ncbi:MAG: helix-turn-helix domain-containing protein [Lepagella sp.]
MKVGLYILHYFLLSPIVLIVAMCVCSCHKEDNDIYSHLRDRLDEAVRLQFDADSTDAAMMIYSDIAASYSPDMPLEVKQLVVEALNRMWYVYYFEMFDYADATECLESGFDICRNDSVESSRLYLNKGITYSLLAMRQRQPSDKIFDLADANLKEAHRRSILSKNANVADYALLNMIVLYDKMSYPIESLDSILKQTILLHDDNSDGDVRFAVSLYSIVHHFQNKKYAEVVKLVDDHLSTYDFPSDEIRNKYQLLLYKARALNEHGYPADAVILLDSIKIDADSLGLVDILMPVDELKAGAFVKLGRPFDASLLMIDYYEQRDAQISEETIITINELPLIHSINKSRNELLKANYKRKLVVVYASLVSIVIVFLSLLLVIIVRNNKKLRNANKILFQRNEEQLKAFEAKGSFITQYSSGDANKQDDSLPEADDDKSSGVTNLSSAEDSELRNVYDNAVRCIEDNRLWIDPSLTISQLAVTLKVGEKMLSRAVHVYSNMNFTSFINHYRILEASMMLGNNKEFGYLSIQGIAEMVGFKSRTSFIASFKQFVGMLPSAYRKIAAKQETSSAVSVES